MTDRPIFHIWGGKLFTDFQVETFSSTKENILSHRSSGRQSSTSPSRTKGVVAEQIPAKTRKHRRKKVEDETLHCFDFKTNFF